MFALLNNRYVAGFVGAAAVVAGFLLWLAGHDRRVIRNHDNHIKRKSAEKLVERKDENDEKLEKARAARDAVRGDAPDPTGMSGAQRRRLIRD